VYCLCKIAVSNQSRTQATTLAGLGRDQSRNLKRMQITVHTSAYASAHTHTQVHFVRAAVSHTWHRILYTIRDAKAQDAVSLSSRASTNRSPTAVVIRTGRTRWETYTQTSRLWHTVFGCFYFVYTTCSEAV